MVSKGCIPDYSGMTYAMLLERGGVQWPCNSAHPDGTVRLYEKHDFPSNWQIAESYEKDLETGHEHTLREYREKKDPADRAFLLAKDYHPPVDEVDDDFPMIATSGRQVYHWHTRTKTAKARALADAAPGAFVAVNSADARSLGIADGDAVRVVSRRGTVEAPAKVGDVVAPGVVFIPFHYGELGAHSSPNRLMAKAWDPVSKQPVQKYAAVRLERVGPAEESPWWADGGASVGAAERMNGGPA
jgi:anaerobic selenocysteine-containing dehydrogenase